MIILTYLGPEKLGLRFGVAHDRDMGEAAGREALAAVVGRDGGEEEGGRSSGSEGGGDMEKGPVGGTFVEDGGKVG